MSSINQEQHINPRRAILERSINFKQQLQQVELNRTQQKLQLQRLSLLMNDNNYLDHPSNMKRLTEELDNVNREYSYIRHYQDPLKESFKRLTDSNSKDDVRSTSWTKSDKHQQQELQKRLLRSDSGISSSSRSSSSNCSKSSSSITSSSISTNTSISTSYFALAEKSSLLARWFGSNEESLPVSATPTEEQCNSVIYSCHPTIATQIKLRNKK
ncbi:hypothetical protein [Parasitella parasitica]|uniref:Uncharacterized protein n=1 Tax=Parasitella parasitica TaxID=35722 RepID=A0A0B7NDK4_9FUNG|nr:hypothetical protein [Parasitella parasitica]